MPHRIRTLACVWALAASATSHAVTAWQGIDFDHLQYELIDLAPDDGIAPSLSFGVGDGRTSGPGDLGGTALASERYGSRVFSTAPDGLYGLDSNFAWVDSVLSPRTAAVFTVAAFVGVSARGAETGSASVSLSASLYGPGNPSGGEDRISVNSLDAPERFIERDLRVRIDNQAEVAGYFDVGYVTSRNIAANGVPAVPEPGTWALLALGVPMVAGAVRKRRVRVRGS